MANMTAEKISTQITNRSNLPEEVKQILRQGQIDFQKAKEQFESLTPLCPIDGSLGKFVRYEGAYTRVHGIFKCENGHEFNYSSRAKRSAP